MRLINIVVQQTSECRSFTTIFLEKTMVRNLRCSLRLIAGPKGRLTRLMKFTTGEVRELVKPFIHDNPEYGY